MEDATALACNHLPCTSETCADCAADRLIALSPLKELMALYEKASGDLSRIKVVKPKSKYFKVTIIGQLGVLPTKREAK